MGRLFIREQSPLWGGLTGCFRNTVPTLHPITSHISSPSLSLLISLQGLLWTLSSRGFVWGVLPLPCSIACFACGGTGNCRKKELGNPLVPLHPRFTSCSRQERASPSFEGTSARAGSCSPSAENSTCRASRPMAVKMITARKALREKIARAVA